MEDLASFESVNESSEHASRAATAPTSPGEFDMNDKIETEKDNTNVLEESMLSSNGAGEQSVTGESGMKKAFTKLGRAASLLRASETKLKATENAAEKEEINDVTENNDVGMKKAFAKLGRAASLLRASETKLKAKENGAEKEEITDVTENDDVEEKENIENARKIASGIAELYEKTIGKLRGLAPVPADVAKDWKAELEGFIGMLKPVTEQVSEGSGTTVLRTDVAKHLPFLEKLDESILRAMDELSALEGEVTFGEAVTVKEGGLSPEAMDALLLVQREMSRILQDANGVNDAVVKEMKVAQEFIDSLPKHSKMVIDPILWEGLRKQRIFSIIQFMKQENMYDLASAEIMSADLEKVWVIWDRKRKSRSVLNHVRDYWSNRNSALLTAIRVCQNSIRNIKEEFPKMGHTELEKQKIRNCSDLGFAGLEAYSWVLKSHCAIVLARIDETIDAHKAKLSEKE